MEADKPEETAAAPAVDMELEAAASDDHPREDGAAAETAAVANGGHNTGENGAGKRGRGDEGEEDEEAKKQRVERSVEEERLESLEEGDKGEAEEEGVKDEVEEEGVKDEVEDEGVKVEEKDEVEEEAVKEGEKDEDGGEKVDGGPVKLGPKSFGSSVDMFHYFYNLLHTWSPNLDINKYEGMVLADLIKKGHPEPDKKIGGGIQAFQVRNHPLWKSRCFFLVRDDGSSDDFSFRKCIDHIIPLPDNMKVTDGKKSGGNQKGGGRGFGGRGGQGRGGGRGGRGKGGRFGK